MTPATKVPKARLLLLAGAMVALLSGLDAAMLRLGLRAPIQSMDLANLHGPLMVFGFLGTAICLERAVALQSSKRRIALLAYIAPVVSVAATGSALIQITAAPDSASRTLPASLWGISMLSLLLMYVAIWLRQPARAVIIEATGALSGLVGVTLWGFGWEAAAIVPWWTCFLVLTILGERVELARVAFNQATETRVLGEITVMLAGLLLTLWFPTIGFPILGLGLFIACIDMASHDVARRTINNAGLTRFMAAAMLSGYFWGGVAAVMWMVNGPIYSGYAYDTVVHALSVGFALSMVMAHAPIIIPAIARRTIPYHPVMWAVLALLQTGLILRVIAGSRGEEGFWQLGGVVDVVAVLAFVVMTLTLVVSAQRKYKKRRTEVQNRVREKSLGGTK